MGTRGAIGFRVNEEDKITYNHFDSYPSGLGVAVVDFIRTYPLSEMKDVAQDLKLIDTKVAPTEKQIKDCEQWTDLTVSECSTSDWYCLLRNAQGKFDAYMSGLKYMNNGNSFVLDSLFCEYVYIINLDTNELEFYSGFNKKESTRKGRYANQKREGERESGYFGVALIKKYPLKMIKEMSEEDISVLITQMEKKATSFYMRQERELKKEKNK